MGKTQKPLTILVADELFDTPEVRTLADKGHSVSRLSEVGHPSSDADTETADLMLGPKCWRITPELLPYLDLAIKSTRGVKYPKGKK